MFVRKKRRRKRSVAKVTVNEQWLSILYRVVCTEILVHTARTGTRVVRSTQVVLVRSTFQYVVLVLVLLVLLATSTSTEQQKTEVQQTTVGKDFKL